MSDALWSTKPDKFVALFVNMRSLLMSWLSLDDCMKFLPTAVLLLFLASRLVPPILLTPLI